MRTGLRSLLAPTLLVPVLLALFPGCSDPDSVFNPAPDGPVSDAGPSDGNPDALPDPDATFSLKGLTDKVEIIRDSHGVVHIYARNYPDAYRVQGYTVARDRAVQIELMRRTALGRTAAIFGKVYPESIDEDIVMRTLNMQTVASYEYLFMPLPGRAWAQAFADGVSQHFEEISSGAVPLQNAGTLLKPEHFAPFSQFDSFLIDKLMQFSMSWSVGREIASSRLALAVQGAENPRSRAMLPDLLRFAPAHHATTLGELDSSITFPKSPLADPDPPFAGSFALMQAAQPAVEAWSRAARAFGTLGAANTNLWAVAPSRSATGGSILAVDTHFNLTSPPPLWLVHIAITNEGGRDGTFVAGAAIPGVPGIAYGFNQEVAWGSSASNFDVVDLYHEQFTPDGFSVMFQDEPVGIYSGTALVNVADGPAVHANIGAVPHHGPFVPVLSNHNTVPIAEQTEALTFRWSGLQQSSDIHVLLHLPFARGIEHVLATAATYPSAIRSYMVASANEILYMAPPAVPLRDSRATEWDAKTYRGTLPCFVLPGDGRAELVWFLPPTAIPVVQRPQRGFIITANADPLRGTLDNDPSNDATIDGTPAFLSCNFDIGFRQGRIQDRILSATSPLTIEDAASIQSDVHSGLASRLVPYLVDALERVQKERYEPGAEPALRELAESARFASSDPGGMIALLHAWGSQGNYEVRSGVTATGTELSTDAVDEISSKASLLFHTWLARLVYAVFSDAMGELGIGMQGLYSVSEDLPIRALLHLL
ncbi:MAG: penicillin acylase family protein, partial [Polyangiaceae bacterium]|nr:penicillin acylase family protein [Polyangiaceae bacterium]